MIRSGGRTKLDGSRELPSNRPEIYDIIKNGVRTGLVVIIHV